MTEMDTLKLFSEGPSSTNVPYQAPSFDLQRSIHEPNDHFAIPEYLEMPDIVDIGISHHHQQSYHLGHVVSPRANVGRP